MGRTWLGIIAAAIVVVAGSAAYLGYTELSGHPAVPVAVTYSTISTMPLNWAIQNGFISKYFPGFTITPFSNSGDTIRALEAGHGEIAVTSTLTALASIAEGAPLKIVAVWDSTPYASMILVAYNSSYQSLDQLRGKTFALSSPSSLDDITLRLVAAQLGWGKNYTAVYVNTLTAQAAAVIAGKIDTTLFDYWRAIPFVTSQQLRALYIANQTWPIQVVVARDDFIQHHPSEIKRFLADLYKLDLQWYSDPNPITYYMVKYFRFSASEAQSFRVAQKYSTTPAQAVIVKSQIQQALQALASSGGIPSNSTKIPLTQFYTDQFTS